MSGRKGPGFSVPDPRRISHEVEEEVEFHIESRVERLVEAGMSPEEARAEALRRFGDVDGLKAKMIREGEAAMRRCRSSRWSAGYSVPSSTRRLPSVTAPIHSDTA